MNEQLDREGQFGNGVGSRIGALDILVIVVLLGILLIAARSEFPGIEKRATPLPTQAADTEKTVE